jgi:SAM-dependent methyltransferase
MSGDYSHEMERDIYFNSKVPLFRERLELLATRFPARGRLLDIGAAYGVFLEMAKAAGWEAVGVEVDSAMAAAAAAKGFGVHTSPVERLGLPDSTYEAVICSEVLCLMPDPALALRVIHRILKPGGVLYVRDYNASFHLSPVWGALPGFLGLRPVIVHDTNFTPAALRAILARAGFENISVTNSKLSSGDPYRTGGRLGRIFTRAAKALVYLLAQAAWHLSGKRLLTGPSLTAWAEKGTKR